MQYGITSLHFLKGPNICQTGGLPRIVTALKPTQRPICSPKEPQCSATHANLHSTSSHTSKDNRMRNLTRTEDKQFFKFLF